MRTCKALMVGVTLDACDGNGMVPRWDTPCTRVLGIAEWRHIVLCVLWIPHLRGACMEHSPII